VHLVGFLFIVVIADARNHEPEIYHLPAWCPGGCNEGGLDDVTQLTNAQSRHQRHKNAAR
jgi:hypothetical protein